MMGAVSDIREANRPSPLFHHLTTVSEGIAVLGWITIDPKPAAFIADMLGSAQFYGNRVIKEYKEKSVSLKMALLYINLTSLQRPLSCRMGASILPHLYFPH